MVVPPMNQTAVNHTATTMATVSQLASGGGLHDCTHVMLHGMLEQLGWMFYYVKPNTSLFTSVDDVPNYEVQIFPIFGVLMLIEQVIRFYQHKRISRLSDVVVNIGAGLIFVAVRVMLLGSVMKLFYFLYDNFRIADLDYCPSTWLLSLLLVEFVYYWVHRSLHEINVFWASHQFHHNAVEIDITTTLRDTVVDLVIYEFFPAPLALIIPPPILLIHMQFSLIYQVWLHTEVVTNLGPIEYLINTPRQHRIHHGKNPYCIDKNYGALIMIWDRLFGTYQGEKEKVMFGTTEKGYETFDTITLHWYYYYDSVWLKFKSMNTFGDKLRALFYGPGWAPGKPRTGLISDIPPVNPYEGIQRYDAEITFWESFYVMVHSFLIVLGFYVITDHPMVRNSPLYALYIMLYVVFVLTVFGTIFDRRTIAPLLEAVRCLLFFPFDAYVIRAWIVELQPPEYMLGFIDFSLDTVRLFHVLSIVLWIFIWYRTARCFPNKKDESFYSYTTTTNNETALIKEDKYVLNNINYRQPWHIACYTITIIVSLTFMWFVFALRYEECNRIFYSPPTRIEL